MAEKVIRKTKYDNKERFNQFSEKMSKLAQPKKKNPVYEDDPSVWAVKKATLKYRATKRIQNLAKPKFVTSKKIDREPVDELTQSITSVSPSALSYKPTKRILELALPK